MPKVTHLSATNFKRIDAIDIDTAGRFAVVLRGSNRQGKSSVLDALAALACGRGEIPEQPINTRSPNAPAVLIGTITGTALGTLTVTRRFTRKGTDLVVKATDDDGRTTTVTPPQSALDAVIGATSIRPLDIISADRRTRLKALTSAGGVAAEWDELEKTRKAAVAARTEAARTFDAAERSLGPKPTDPKPCPAAPPNAARARMQAAHAASTAACNAVANARRALDGVASEAENTRARIAQYRAEIDRLQKIVELREQESQQLAAQCRTLEATAADADTAYRAAESAAVAESAAADAWAQAKADERTAAATLASWSARADAVARADTAKTNAAAEVDRLDAEIAALLHGSRLSHIPGLSIDPEGEVYLSGAPLSQASGMEKVVFGARLALTANPLLPVLAIDEADCLDDEAVKALVEFAVEHDLSVWLTGVRLPGDEVHAEILAVDVVDGRAAGSPARPDAANAKQVADIEL